MKLFIANITSLYSIYLSQAQKDPRKVFLFKYFEIAFTLKKPTLIRFFKCLVFTGAPKMNYSPLNEAVTCVFFTDVSLLAMLNPVALSYYCRVHRLY